MADIYRTNDIKAFFQEMGVTDDGDLQALSRMFCGVSTPEELEELRDIVLRGCFRDAVALRDALMVRYLPDGDEERKAVDALVRLRTFTQLQLVPAVANTGIVLHNSDYTLLSNVFGREVPEWLFPALISLVQERTSFAVLNDKVSRVMAMWGYGTGTYALTLLLHRVRQEMLALPSSDWKIHSSSRHE